MQSGISLHRPLRILHCPASMGGHPEGLARAERTLGLNSVAVAFEESRFDYETDEVLFRKGEDALVREAKRWRFVWRALREFDVVHFNFGRTIMPMSFAAFGASRRGGTETLSEVMFTLCARIIQMCDLPLLRWAGKGIVFTYQGDDARQGDHCREHMAISPAQEVDREYYLPQTDARKREAIATVSRYADRVYALNPDLLHVLPIGAEFLPYANVDPSEWCPVARHHLGDKLPTVLHAPSHRGVKGTRFILTAVDRVREEGVNFDFVIVEELTRAEARRLYTQADLLVDQLLCGWYGGLAVELMALGKPAMCYLREEDLKFIPAEMRSDIPIIQVTPQTIYSVLREWLTTRRHELADVGARSRAYVEKWHDPLKIAARLKKDYEDIIASKSR